MSKQPNNPAGRLLAIIRKLQAVQKGKNILTDQAWAKVFQIDPDNTGLLMDRIGKCLQLGNQIIENVKKLNLNQDLFLKDINQIILSFRQMNLQENINSTLSRIRVESIRGLEYCDHEFSRQSPEKVIPETDLKNIYEEICSLLEEVAQADIDSYLKNFMLDKLDLLRQAIELYDVDGCVPIEKALCEITGSIVLTQEKLKGQDFKEIGKKFIRILVTLYLATQIINNIAQLPESISKIIPGDTVYAEEIIDSQNTDIEGK